MTAIAELTSRQISAARALPTATLHEAAGRIGALPAAIKPITPEFTLCGPAFTVRCSPVDNLWIHRAIYRARPGDVLIVSTASGDDAGYWGEILNEAAIASRLAGLVIDGGVRDCSVLRRNAFPVFSRCISIQGTGKDQFGAGWLQQSIVIGKIVVHPGDLVAGDADGVVVVPKAKVDTVIEASRQREADEAEKIKLIRGGARTIDLYNLSDGRTGGQS